MQHNHSGEGWGGGSAEGRAVGIFLKVRVSNWPFGGHEMYLQCRVGWSKLRVLAYRSILNSSHYFPIDRAMARLCPPPPPPAMPALISLPLDRREQVCWGVGPRVVDIWCVSTEFSKVPETFSAGVDC